MFPNISELKRLRIKSDMSQQDLASKVGISQSAITKYENGTQIPSYAIAIKMFDILMEHEFLEEPQIKELMEKNVVSLPLDAVLEEAIRLMTKNSISQIPIIENSIIYGTINESKLLDLLDRYGELSHLKNDPIESIMDEPLPLIPGSAKISFISSLLKMYGAVLVSENGIISGIIAKADLLQI